MLHTSNQNMFTKILTARLSRSTYIVISYQTLIYLFHFQENHIAEIYQFNRMIDNHKGFQNDTWFRIVSTSHMRKKDNK